ncbi:MAG: 16S rRNA (cytosine(1402)-N(4))-methyltransferase RsmH [Pseudolabrys sp.]|nr:16S rRNA (cytosine(1402)-N(4))-methyltransferase RsmH [Pseudolabrys sp.]MSP31262.1 16S rRNA (cytosine(1402)-N(4))-methyltransferase RsmH [Pseudolabrys sp.]
MTPILSHDIPRFLIPHFQPRFPFWSGRMMAGDGFGAVAGGPARHIPVLGRRAVELLKVRDGGIYIDATFGAGGYTRGILAATGTHVIGIDRDRHAIALGADLVQAAQGRLTLIEDQFSNLDTVARSCGYEAVDGVVLDLGVSSMQLDAPERGFSFRLDGPLDMRMGTDGPSAADIVARASERDLANIIFLLGEERHSRAVARAIVKARTAAPIETTRALADIVSRVVRSRPGDIHPATRTFQGLRIFVNDELGELVSALGATERILKAGGRLVVISFHSLEDRIVKSFLSRRTETRGGSRHVPEPVRPAPSFNVLTKRPEVADGEEVARNPRARSAKLRAAERTAAPAQTSDPSDLLPHLPSFADIMQGH